MSGEDTKQAKGCLFLIVALVILALTVVFCGDSDPDAEPEDGETAAEGSSLACGRFSFVLNEVQAGVLTDEELRAELQTIRGNALSGTPGVQSAATALVSAATANDNVALLNAMGEMVTACAEAGHRISVG